MLKQIQRITDVSTWAASADLAGIPLPRDGVITEVTIRANITATLTAAAYDDWFRRVIQNIRIEGDGGRAYLGMGGDQMSRMLSLWAETLTGAPTLHSNGAGIALAAPDVASTSFRSVFKFHPGSNPHDPFDMTAVIPARALSTLQVKLTTTADTVVDAAGLITAGTFNYEVHTVLGVPVASFMMTPVGSTLSYPHTANFSDFVYEIDIPGGAWLRSILMLVQDHTGTVSRRKDDEVAGIRIRRSKVGDYILAQNIFEAKHAMAARYGLRGIAGDVGPLGAIATTRPSPETLLSMVPAGWLLIDMRQFAATPEERMWGLDMRNTQTGDYKLGLTIENYTGGDDTIIYWDQLRAVEPNMVGR